MPQCPISGDVTDVEKGFSPLYTFCYHLLPLGKRTSSSQSVRELHILFKENAYQVKLCMLWSTCRPNTANINMLLTVIFIFHLSGTKTFQYREIYDDEDDCGLKFSNAAYRQQL